MKSVSLFVFCMTASTMALADHTMHFSTNCVVKKLGAGATGLAIAVGNPAHIETTTSDNYEAPSIVPGVNQVRMGTVVYQGNAGRFTYKQNSPTGNIFEIIGGSSKVVLKQGSPSAYTGKFLAIVEVDGKKVAELTCAEPNK